MFDEILLFFLHFYCSKNNINTTTNRSKTKNNNKK